MFSKKFLDTHSPSEVLLAVEKMADSRRQEILGYTLIDSIDNDSPLDVIKALIEASSDLNFTNYFEDAALHYAVKRGSFEAVQMLLGAGADVHVRGKYESTPLHAAALHDRCPLCIIKTLLDAGADVKARDTSGNTPLHNAVYGHQPPQVILTLRDAGADPKAKNEDGKTAWDFVKIQGKPPLRDMEVWKILKEGSPDER